MPSLGLLIGLTTALTVVAVAAVTLSISLSFAVRSANDIGLTQADLAADLAARTVEKYVGEPRDAARAAAEYWRSGNRPFISQSADPIAAAAELAQVQVTAFRTGKRLSSCNYLGRDGMYIGAQRHPIEPLEHDLTYIKRRLPTVAQTYTQTLTSTYKSNASLSPAHLQNPPVLLSFTENTIRPGTRLDLIDTEQLQGENRAKAYLPTPIALRFFPAGPYLQLTYYTAAYNASGTSMGLHSCGVDVEPLSSFLDAVRPTKGTQLFMIGPNLKIIATSHPGTYMTTYENVTRNLTTPDNCASTILTTSFSPTVPVTWLCRTHLADFNAYPAAAAVGRGGIPEDRQPILLSVGGEKYFVASSAVEQSGVFGYSMRVVAIIPQADIVGDLNRGVAIAIGVTAAVLVVAVAITSVTVRLLLRPLATVQERMERAATFQDDAEAGDRGTSFISEVRGLQESYEALSSELKRLSAFVPQSVLANRNRSQDSDGADDDLDMSLTRPSETGTNRSHRRSRNSESFDGTASRNTRRSGNGVTDRGSRISGGATLNTSVGLVDKKVTMLFANTRGFNSRFVGQTTHHQAHTRYAAFADAVCQVISENRGVIEYFHGDRVLASFNASRPCVQHMLLAVQAGVALASWVVPSSMPGASTSVGISSGRCRVGNVGCSSHMRFNIMGATVTAASKLCQLADNFGPELDKQHHTAQTIADGGVGKPANAVRPTATVTSRHGPVPAGSVVLIPAAMVGDLESHFTTRFVDLASLPSDNGQSKTQPVAVVSHAAAVAGKQDEWLYVVNRGTLADSWEGILEEAYRKAARGLFPDARGALDAAMRDPEGREAPAAKRLRDYLDSLMAAE